MAGIAVHVPVGGRGAPVGEQYGDLMHGLRGQRQEVPEHVGVLEVGGRVALLGVYEVGELDGVPDEEHRGVVPDHVIVAVLGVELHREPPGIPFRVRRTLLPSHGGEAYEHVGPLAHLVKELGLGVLGHVRGDLEVPVGSGPFGVDHPLRYPLAIEVGQLFDEVHVLNERGTVPTRSHGVLVVINRLTEVLGQRPLLGSLLNHVDNIDAHR